MARIFRGSFGIARFALTAPARPALARLIEDRSPSSGNVYPTAYTQWGIRPWASGTHRTYLRGKECKRPSMAETRPGISRRLAARHVAAVAARLESRWQPLQRIELLRRTRQP